jgi:hypothetical protein
MLEMIRVEDMLESFRIKVAPGADPLAVARAASELPGVSNVVDEGCMRDNPTRSVDSAGQCDFRGRGR